MILVIEAIQGCLLQVCQENGYQLLTLIVLKLKTKLVFQPILKIHTRSQKH